jgi:DNA-binding MarR family transcriptional regulator
VANASASGAPDEPIEARLGAARGLHRLLTSSQYFKAQRALELQLGPSDIAVMGHLFFEGAQAPGQLSAWMGVTSGTMTALLNRVEKAGFLRRQPNPEDRRGQVITLTPAGRHAMEWFYEQFEEIISEALADLSQPEIQQFHTALNTLAGSLCTHAGHPDSQD